MLTRQISSSMACFCCKVNMLLLYFLIILYCYIMVRKRCFTYRRKQWRHDNVNQSADSTAWTGFLMVFFYYSWYCVNANQRPYQHFITCTNVKIQSFNVPLQGFICVNSSSLNLLLFVMNNRTGSTYIDTFHQKVQCFDISRRLGDLAPISQTNLIQWSALSQLSWLSLITGLVKNFANVQLRICSA